jgi:hypothetical protein
MLQTNPIQPSYLPEGFKLRRRIHGVAAAGFLDDPSQATLVHTRGGQLQHWSSPLLVYVSQTPGQVLAGTEQRAGVAVDLGVAGVTATYHDGMWAQDGAAVATLGDEQSMYWSTSGPHSITVRTTDQTLAVRGPRDVGVAELVKIARSLLRAR